MQLTEYEIANHLLFNDCKLNDKNFQEKVAEVLAETVKIKYTQLQMARLMLKQ